MSPTLIFWIVRICWVGFLVGTILGLLRREYTHPDYDAH